MHINNVALFSLHKPATNSGEFVQLCKITIQFPISVSSNITRKIKTCLHNYSMEQSTSWEANWFPASQEIPCILWNPKVHYHIHTLTMSWEAFYQLQFLFKDLHYRYSTKQHLTEYFHTCTVHVDSIKSFICPTNAHKLLQNCSTVII